MISCRSVMKKMVRFQTQGAPSQSRPWLKPLWCTQPQSLLALLFTLANMTGQCVFCAASSGGHLKCKLAQLPIGGACRGMSSSHERKALPIQCPPQAYREVMIMISCVHLSVIAHIHRPNAVPTEHRCVWGSCSS